MPADPPVADESILLSASMIVRDEEDCLRRCLDSITAVVDEIVVYDTGSADSTREIARRQGALVVDGYWDDDFARARTASLQECRGVWILCIDADEVLVCADPVELRAQLRELDRATRDGSGTVDALDLAVDNVLVAGEVDPESALHSKRHRSLRIFDRTSCTWSGSLHEKIVRRHPDGGGPETEPASPALSTVRYDAARIVHFGYTRRHVSHGGGKAARNLRIAEAALAADGETAGDRGAALANVARSLAAAGDLAGGLERAREAVGSAREPGARQLAFYTAIQLAVFAGEIDEAGACLVELDRLHGEAPSLRRDQGWIPDSSIALLIELVRAGDGDDVHPLPAGADLQLLVAQSLNLPPALGDRLLEACRSIWPGETAILACGMRIATQLPPERALTWLRRFEELTP